MLQSTEPFERHRISVATKQTEPTALLNFGLQDNALKDQTQQPLHMDALAPPTEDLVASVRLAVNQLLCSSSSSHSNSVAYSRRWRAAAARSMHTPP